MIQPDQIDTVTLRAFLTSDEAEVLSAVARGCHTITQIHKRLIVRGDRRRTTTHVRKAAASLVERGLLDRVREIVPMRGMAGPGRPIFVHSVSPIGRLAL